MRIGLLFMLLLGFSSLFGAAGDLDTTFGNNGIVLQNFLGSEDGLAAAQDKQGRIVVAGIYRKPNLTTDIIVARFNPDGTLDTTFGNNGYVIFDKADDDIANGVLIDPNGKILVVGQTDEDDDNYRELLIIRYNDDGTLDTTFNNSGYTAYEESRDGGLQGFDIKLDGDKIVVAGSTVYGRYSFVARFNSNGSFDTSFSGSGFTYFDTDITEKESTFSLIVDTDKYVMGGINTDGNNKRNFLLWTIDKTGVTKQKFVVSTTNGDDLVMQNGSSLAKDSVGRYILVGMSDDNGDNIYDIASIVRFLPTGALDNSFGNNGIATLNLGKKLMITSTIVDNNDKIYVGGDIAGSPTDALVLRLNSDGTPDSTFGQSGKSIINVSSYNDTIYALLFDANSNLIGAGVGKQNDYGDNGDFMLLKLKTTGTQTPSPTPSPTTTVTVPIGWPGKLILTALLFLGVLNRRKRA